MQYGWVDDSSRNIAFAAAVKICASAIIAKGDVELPTAT
jgi:hypothetical protein